MSRRNLDRGRSGYVCMNLGRKIVKGRRDNRALTDWDLKWNGRGGQRV